MSCQLCWHAQLRFAYHIKNNNNTMENFICVPYSVLSRKDLSQTEKLIFGFINGFENKTCYASNQYIADVIGVSARQVSRAISNLEAKTLVSIFNGKGLSRSISTTTSVSNNQDINDINHDISVQDTTTPVSNNNIDNNIKNKIVDNIVGETERKYFATLPLNEFGLPVTE